MKEILLRERSPTHGATALDFVLADGGHEHLAHSAALLPEWLPPRAAYAPFALVQALFELILAERPARLVVEHVSAPTLELARLAAAFGCETALRLPTPNSPALASGDEEPLSRERERGWGEGARGEGASNPPSPASEREFGERTPSSPPSPPAPLPQAGEGSKNSPSPASGRAVAESLNSPSPASGRGVGERVPGERTLFPTPDALRWTRGVYQLATTILPPHAGDPTSLCAQLGIDPARITPVLPPLTPLTPTTPTPIGYEAYAFGCRDHDLLERMQCGYVPHFAGCTDVVDLGCGTGVFLELLHRQQIPARGVERNAMSVRYARSLGHEVIEADAIAWLEANPASCDGLYCSHFIEHLPIDAAERLLAACSAALRPGGMALFVFPDPESIRSQLLGFWRDPEHVRFYHPELVGILAQVHGLKVEFDSHRADGRSVVSFSMHPPLPEPAPPQAPRGWAKVLARLGIASSAQLNAERARADALEAAVRKLWAVNQTWAWEDNAVLRLRKPG